MKKGAALLCVITFLVGLAAGLSVLYFYTPEALLQGNNFHPVGEGGPSEPDAREQVISSPATVGLPEPSALPMDVLSLAPEVLKSLKAQNYVALSGFIHPEEGLTLVPYSTVEPGINLCFTAKEIAGAASNSNKYIWGLKDGSGLPIELTMTDYFKEYVFDVDYTTAPNIALNRVQQTGNSLENVEEAYPDCPYVEFNFSGIDPALEGMDWRSLKLVFSQYQGQWKLVALIHSQWTV